MNKYKLTLNKKDLTKLCVTLSNNKDTKGIITKITSKSIFWKDNLNKENDDLDILELDIESFLKEVLKKEDLAKGKLTWISFPDSINVTILEEIIKKESL